MSWLKVFQLWYQITGIDLLESKNETLTIKDKEQIEPMINEPSGLSDTPNVYRGTSGGESWNE